MDENERGSDRRKRDRLVARLDKMVESGRVTAQEAERLRGASAASDFDAAVRDIRVRHAGTRLGAAVIDGSLNQEEADGILERLRRGEHSAALRAAVTRLRPGGRSGGRRLGPLARQEDAPKEPPHK